MSNFIIQGPSKLKGEVRISGSKNAALPIIAATILAKGEFTIENVPEIADIFNMLELLKGIGAKYTFKNNVCVIDTSTINSCIPDFRKMRNIRASVLMAGPLLTRCGKVKISHPGGCFIGARPIDVHLEAFTALGCTINTEPDFYELNCDKLIGSDNILCDFSVTGTENAVMAAVLAKGNSTLKLAATEPHVTDLCDFLVKMGARINGIGTHTLEVTGVKELSPVKHKLIYDQIEAGTFALAAAVSRGEVVIDGFITAHHDLFLKKLREANVNYEILSPEKLKIMPSTIFQPVEIHTNVYPGFPTDLQAPFAVFLTQAEGSSQIYETIYEGRLNYINELNKMGANGVIRNSHEATITGPTPLYGTLIKTLDLRAGATLIIASLVAEGESVIENIELIDRGYEKIEEKLKALGANIRRVEEIEVK